MANKAIKYRIYPTTEQSIMFSKTFGCCRKVYNLMLSDKIEGYKATGKFPTVTPAKYKKDYPYLKEVDSLALANKQLDLQAAFRNTFSKSRKKKNGFPKFKSAKHSRKSYTTNNQKGTVAILDKRYIRLPKVGKVNAVIVTELADNVLQYRAEQGEITDERKQTILEAIEDGKKYGYNLLRCPHKYFFVEQFFQTEYEKTSYGGARFVKVFDLNKLLGIDELPSTEEIANILAEKTWE